MKGQTQGLLDIQTEAAAMPKGTYHCAMPGSGETGLSFFSEPGGLCLLNWGRVLSTLCLPRQSRVEVSSLAQSLPPPVSPASPSVPGSGREGCAQEATEAGRGLTAVGSRADPIGRVIT